MTADSIYRKLQRHLDRMPVPFPATHSGVEIRILKALFTEDEARVALALSMIPEPANVIARRLRSKMSAERVSEMLEQMGERGLINRLPAPGGLTYAKAVFVVGFYEAQVNRLTPEFERDVMEYMDEAFGKALHSLRTPQMRTVPIHKRIAPPEFSVTRYDDVNEMTRSSEGPFAVMNCICAQGRQLLGEPCQQTTNPEHCLMFGVAAEWLVKRGVARSISREEMLAFLDQADRDGLVLQPQNTENPLFVCACCGCCCGVLTTAKKLPRPADFLATGYYAEVNAEECEICGACETRCQMGAIKSGTEPAQVDLGRCIGCGLCASTCPSGAMKILAKPNRKTPPKDTGKLYQQMFYDRYGAVGVAKLIGKKILGMNY